MAERDAPRSLELFGSERNGFIDELLALDESVPRDATAVLDALLEGAQPPHPRNRQLKVFLSYAREDESQARQLYDRIRAAGYAPWMDVHDLLPGMPWEMTIDAAIEACDAAILCLSQRAITKTGHVQVEIRRVLERVLRLPFGEIGLIPARLDDCEVPRPLRAYQWVDLHREDGFDSLLRSLSLAAEAKYARRR
jgi:hypothetical protein